MSLNRAVAKPANTHSKLAALARSTLKLETNKNGENMSALKHLLIGNYAPVSRRFPALDAQLPTARVLSAASRYTVTKKAPHLKFFILISFLFLE
jgi:hypothetical protein